jgi:hypothetical protein
MGKLVDGMNNAGGEAFVVASPTDNDTKSN